MKYCNAAEKERRQPNIGKTSNDARIITLKLKPLRGGTKPVVNHYKMMPYRGENPPRFRSKNMCLKESHTRSSKVIWPLSILLTKLRTHISQGLQKYCETS